MKFDIRFPEGNKFGFQSEEYFFLAEGECERKIRLHDYVDIYQIPGLYQYLLVEKLRDQSPDTLAALLAQQVLSEGVSPTSLRVLDMGAGVGLSGKSLRHHEFLFIVGWDILAEAKVAAQREYPEVFSEYYVGNMLNLSPDLKSKLTDCKLNCLVCCSALSCHLPIQVFIEAFNLIETEGWIAFNINQAILQPETEQPGDFSHFYKRLVQEGMMQVYCTHNYRHRISTNGESIYYCAIIGRKKGAIHPDFSPHENG